MVKPEDNTPDTYSLTLTELTISLGVQPDFVLRVVEEAILDPQHGPIETWEFDSNAIRRLRLVSHLTQDLGINVAGAGLAIELLEEIDRLKKIIAQLNPQD